MMTKSTGPDAGSKEAVVLRAVDSGGEKVVFRGTREACCALADASALEHPGVMFTVRSEGEEDLHSRDHFESCTNPETGEQEWCRIVSHSSGYGRGWWDYPDFKASGYAY